MIRHSTSQNSNNFTISCNLRSKKYDRNEYEQRTEHIHIIRNKIEVIVKYYLIDWCLILKEIIHFLRQIKHHRNTHNQHNRKEECAEEFANYVFVEFFQNGCRV